MFYENLAGFGVLWLCVLAARRLWHATHSPVPAALPSPKRLTPRPLKPTSASSDLGELGRAVEPRTPRDCPLCGHPHPTPLGGHVRQAGVLPWSERKSPRGKRKTLCTAGYAGPNPECDYHGNTDATFHALVGCGRRGADGVQQFKCQACGQRFTSRRGTALYRLRTPATQVAQVLLAVNLGLSIADAALLFQHSEVTVRLWPRPEARPEG